MRAVVDIGSNSIKYTLEQTRGDALSRSSKSKVIALGKGLKHGSPLSDAALERLKVALEEFAKDLKKEPIELVVVGTAALRKCSNPDIAKDLVLSILGAPLQIITGTQEAELSFLGAKSLSVFDNPLCIDVGGASTEVGFLKSKNLHSVPWGALRVHEDLLLSKAPVDLKDLGIAQQKLNREFQKELTALDQNETNAADGILAIGGSLVMCAKSIHPEQKDSPSVNTNLTSLDHFHTKCAALDLAKRVQVLGLSQDRAEISTAGLMCLFAGTDWLNQNRSSSLNKVLITEGGLRNGVFLEWEKFIGLCS